MNTLNYSTQVGAPRNEGASGSRCFKLSLASLILIGLFVAGKLGSVSHAPAQIAIMLSAVGSIAAAVFGIRCFRLREWNRAAAVMGLCFVLPALLGQLFGIALFFDWIRLGF